MRFVPARDNTGIDDTGRDDTERDAAFPGFLNIPVLLHWRVALLNTTRQYTALRNPVQPSPTNAAPYESDTEMLPYRLVISCQKIGAGDVFLHCCHRGSDRVAHNFTHIREQDGVW